MLLAEILEQCARRYPERPALVIARSGASYTFRTLQSQVEKVAWALRQQGYTAGDRLVVMLPNDAAFLITYYAILRLGAVVVPINITLKAMEIRHIVTDSGCSAIVTTAAKLAHVVAGSHEVESVRQFFLYGEHEEPGRDLLELAAHAPPSRTATPGNADDTAVIIYSSGTTGVPKGAMLSHRNLLSNAQAGAEIFAYSPNDIVLTALPLSHIYGQTCTMNASWLQGAKLILHERFDADEILESIQRYRVTAFLGVPTMFLLLRDCLSASADAGKFDLSTIRLLNSGGAAIPVELLKAINALFEVEMIEGYGLSETAPIALSNPLFGIKKAGSVGMPIQGVEARVIDEHEAPLPPHEVGEIVVRGPNVMQGYLNNPEATAEVMRGGWFHTGDLAYVDDDGYFFIAGRKKEMINRAGFKIYPREVEDLLYTHPNICEAAVVGIPDQTRGEEVKAFVVLYEGCGATSEEIIAYCRERLASYKCPAVVEFLDSLPKGSTGKILKRALTAEDSAG